MTIRIQRQDRTPYLTTPFLRGLLRIICVGLGCPDTAPPDISLFVMGDAHIRVINRRFRNKDKATDVLSFSQLEGHQVPPIPGCPIVWGDILISVQSAQTGADKRGHTLEEEIARLVIHGVLHLLGHDHIRGGRQAKRMTLEEARLFELVRSPALWPDSWK